ncbi:hypothetical protein M422DRAFT_194019 [Sphaerobolus stellatus SS14]|uniref:DUF221-domain-containing protein n=1 Tax=Sphaerobolus stellatus (strain SS14) TaxID=990650 RepID=A0A0C9T7K5_SPHS4|nr:hypothetical protein M422DRAFT_194019 [Sphaerobolus stellatus SS14]
MSEVTAGTANGKTTQTFLSALISNGTLLGIELIVFIVLKGRLERIYTPRTFLPPPDKRAEELPSGPIKWLFKVIGAPPEDVIRKNGLDAYMLLRFLWLNMKIFSSFTIVTWIILLPINSAGIKNNSTDGLNKLSWGNITEAASDRYIAHVVIVYLLTFWVLYLLRRESIIYTELRQTYLTSPSYSHLPQSRTVLVTSIPKKMCNERDLRIWGSFVPGGIQNVWVYKDSKRLNEAYGERESLCANLEAATCSLLRDAMKAKQEQDNIETNKSRKTEPLDPVQEELKIKMALLDKLVAPNNRPMHRPKLRGFWGRKIDSITYYKERISELNKTITRLRADDKESKPLGSAFIQCNLQIGAHVLAQCVSHHEPLKMVYKWIQVAPKDVIWDNIDDGVYETRFRYVTSWMLSLGIIIAWFFPVGFVGLLSNISELCQEVKWLAWTCSAPTPIPGIIQGVIPPLFLAIIFAILLWILRGLAWYENLPLYSLLSISVYKRYFLFLVIHGFLTVTLSSGLTATASDIINSPTKTVSELASHLPDASVFFLTWTITRGLTGAGSALLQVFTLLVYFIKKWFLGRTPRQAYRVTFMMPDADFGVILPQLSLLATIGLTYSVLSPIINGLAALAFALFYFAWKFLLTWVFDQPDERETGGLYVSIKRHLTYCY